MNLPELGVRKPITTLMIFLSICLIGIVSFSRLPIDLFPEIEPPAVSVITVYPGAGPEDVETTVTKYIEKALSIVNNLEDITSTSKEGLSMVTCQFEWGTNLDEVTNDIRERLEFAKRELPDDCEEPMIFKFSTSLFPILMFAANARESYPYLKEIIEDRITDHLKRIPGVGATDIIGGLQRQINVELDRGRMEAHHISVNQITNALSEENVTLPVGSMEIGTQEYTIRVPGEFQKVDQIREVIVSHNSGRMVYLKDVARVEDGFREQKRVVHLNQKPALLFFVQKQSGANTVAVAEKVTARVEELKAHLPEDVEIVTMMDNSEFIVRAIKNLGGAIFWGGLFVILITFLFLRQIKPSIFIALSIPFSLIIAFIFLYLVGYTINVMSLASLAIAIGMVVDNSIFILENIYSHLERGEKPSEASIFGASEIGLSVAASTLTTVVVFLPMIFTTGITGIMFKQLSFVVIITLMASLFVSLNFIPMLFSRFIRTGSTSLSAWDGRERRGLMRRFYQRTEGLFKGMEAAYRSSLDWALRHRKTVVAASLFAFLASLLLIPLIGTDFVPEEDSGDLRVNLEFPVGTKMEETARIAEQIEKLFLNEVPEAERIFMRAGQSEDGMGSAFGHQEGAHIAAVGAKLVEQGKRSRSSKEIAQALREKMAKIPGISKMSMSTGNPMSNMVMGGGRAISIEIIGHDLEETNRLANQIKTVVAGIPGTRDVTIDRDFGLPEVKVMVDRKKAASLGLRMSDIAHSLRVDFYGQKATKFKEAEDEYDIFPQMRPDDRKSLHNIEEAIIHSEVAGPVRLKNLAYLLEERGPVDIRRKNQERIVKVEADVYQRSLGEISRDIEEGIAVLDIPPDIDVIFGGNVKEQRESFRDLLLLLGLGIILVYMVMASQFESLMDPFIVMFCTPFAFSGTFLFLYLTNTTLNTLSIIAIIMLMGVVVNNAIVLIDYINILRAREYSLWDAVLNGSAQRLRPVLMATLTTVFGMLPLAISRGEGSEIWKPLGIASIGGLLVSTLVTLILIPVMYSLFEQKVKRSHG
ncbi:MAG: efflux RND transporter permease subunit [bacterium]